MKKYKKLLSTILLIVGVGAVCYGCIKLVDRITDNYQSNRVSAESSTESMPETSVPVVESTESEIIISTEAPTATASPEPVATPEPYVSPYVEYFDAYPDITAWFSIPDTNISYPVMWTPGDETYYLYRHYDGSDNQNGSLLLDTDSSLDPLTTNLIIHGHNMRSGEMFGTLPKYEKQSYYEQHKNMILYTKDGERYYEIISVFRSQVFKKKDTVFKFYKFFQADTEEEFNDFYENIKKMSIYDTGITAEFGDHFITLSTCVSHVENGRFVVVAKELTDAASNQE